MKIRRSVAKRLLIDWNIWFADKPNAKILDFYPNSQYLRISLSVLSPNFFFPLFFGNLTRLFNLACSS